MITITQEAIIVLILTLVASICGYIIGRLTNSPLGVGVLYNDNIIEKNAKVIKNNLAQQKPLIKIDDTKFVTEIDTSSLEKKFDNLGEVKISQDNVVESVNKLKNMKR